MSTPLAASFYEYLAAYAAIVGSIGTLWAMFLSVVYDRARVSVTVVEAWADAAGGNRTPILWVKVRNRGRRVTHIEDVSRVASVVQGMYEQSADITRQVPVRLEEGQSHSFGHGLNGGYAHGQIPLTRWFVQDGGARVFPLRERYRQRAEGVIFWPTRVYYKWKRRR